MDNPVASNPVTLQVLIARVLQRANLEGALDSTVTGQNIGTPGSKFVTFAEVADLVNTSLSTELHDLLRQYIGESYYLKRFPITTIQGQHLYPLPAGLASIIGVDVFLGGPIPIKGRRFQEDDRDRLRLPFGWSVAYPIYYALQGSDIEFLGAPQGGIQVELRYVPSFIPLVNANDTFDDINGWSEIAVLAAASKLLVKDGQLDVAQYLDGHRERMKQKILGMGPQRHAGEPETVNMIQHGRGGWGGSQGHGWDF